ncbi:MAG TPA: LLM class flavin-dependent oxidoreductase [Acidimicrobiia bacterium]|nr:LLM class flavin-dependent oxidoreductase [Acidimicrobiia bacterium]
MTRTRLGILLWSQATNWPQFEHAARHVDRLGYDHLWTWDHLYAIFGDPHQPIFEGWTAIAGCAQVTSRVRLGLMVGANTFRNPGIVTKSAVTLDHISGGRAILGLGGAWHQLEHTSHGIDFGRSAGERLDWLDEAVGVARRLLDGETVDHHGSHYEFVDLRHEPKPIQRHLPIAIGGTGEKKTLRTVAKYADIWNAFGDVDTLKRKAEVLKQHCEEVGRDLEAIEFTVGCKPLIRDTEAEAKALWQAQMDANRTPMSDVVADASFWVGTPTQLAEKIADFKAIGFDTVISEMAAPYDSETLERLIGEVRPMIDG